MLHVGFPESDAAVRHEALTRLRPQLHRHGVGYVGHDDIAALDTAGGWQRHVVTDPEDLRAFERELAALLAAEQERAARALGGPPQAMVVASDHLLGAGNLDGGEAHRLRPLAVPAVAQAIRAAGASRVTLVVSVGRQDQLMERCYLRAIQEGGSHSFAGQFPTLDEPVVEHLPLVERLAALPEVSRVRVRPVEQLAESEAASSAREVLSVLGLDRAIDVSAVSAEVAAPTRYSPRALRLALDINPFLESECERRRTREFLLEQFPADDGEAIDVLTTSQRERILAAHAPANRKLFERYRPDLPADAYASPESTAGLTAPLDASAAQREAGEAGEAGAAAIEPPAPGRRGGLAAGARAVRRAATDRLASWVHRSRWVSEVARHYRVATADVVIVSAPECGSGWLRFMLGIALARHAGRSPHDPLGLTDGGAVDAGLPRIAAAGSLTPAQVRRRRRPGASGPKAVVVVRDPRAVLAAADEPPAPARQRLESLLDVYDAWAAARRGRPDHVAVVRWEDLHDDAPAALGAVLALIGVDSVDPASLRRAVEESAFDQAVAGGVSPRSAGADDDVDARIACSTGAVAFGYGP